MLDELRVVAVLIVFRHHLKDQMGQSQLSVGLSPVRMSPVSELIEAQVRSRSGEGEAESLG